ncbi:MAG: UDP-2,3-diacylglucosamine diphosphatase [Fibrobacter sp.]|nr:UDP-2,3-diacylglucosamine diphosphatase [Fibrobacter sp.]
MDLKAYFISDAHLGIDPPGCVPDREARLVEFLKSIVGDASHLVIAGDLFEFWYEYSYYVSRDHFKLFAALSALVESGTQVHLLQGNHDFAYGDFFPKCLGVLVHKEVVLDIQGKKVLCRHGDGVARSDSGYRFLRKVLDLPLNRWLFKQLHPDWGMALARFVGRNSRKYGESRVIKMDEYLEWAEKAMAESCCDVCILGHHHIPGMWNEDHRLVASPGDWIKKLTYLQMEAGEISLHEFVKD